MGCAWKYGRNFLVATGRANAACSRWLYRVSVSAKDLLTKNTGLYFLFSSSLNRAALTETTETTKYTKSVSLASGLARTRGSVRYFFYRYEGFITFLISLGLVGPLKGDKERL